MRKLSTFIIAAALMCSAMFLGACGSTGGDVEYKVTVKDALGNAYGSDVIVRFMKDGEQAAMQVCDENGVATKTLAAGKYTIELKFADTEVDFYYEEGITVTAKNPEIEMNLSYVVGEESITLTTVDAEYDAYAVSSGCTYVELTKGERNYFLFTPTEAGTYEFSIADGADATIGYYGAPHFIQSDSVAEVVDGKFSVSIKKDMIGTNGTGTTVLVLGIDGNVNNCVLGIERTGDPQYDIEDEPWIIYQSSLVLEEFSLPAGTTLVDFDITADSYNLVYNEFDGYYHLNSEDGPLVYVYLTEDPAYLPCFKNILDRSGVVKYFFDEDGNFVKKESYSELLLQYIEVADEETGVYPLTEDLKYMIQQRGNYVGWWDKESPDFIFKDATGNPVEGLNPDIAWLFMCCYEEQNSSTEGMFSWIK